VKLSGGRIVEATIKAVIETRNGVRLQVSFEDETALIYPWQIVGEARLTSSGLPQLLKNGAFDGRREIYPDHHARWMGIRNGLLLLKPPASVQPHRASGPGYLSGLPSLSGRGDVRRKKRAADNGVRKHDLKLMTALQTFHRLTCPQPKSGAGQNLDDLLLFTVTTGNSHDGIGLV
jgi:hypothetical protein